MTRGKAEAIGVLVKALLCDDCEGKGEVLDAPALVLGGRTYWTPCPTCGGHPDLDALEALAHLLRPSPNAMAHGACELAERQILEHRMQMTQLDALCASLHAIMGDGDLPT